MAPTVRRPTVLCTLRRLHFLSGLPRRRHFHVAHPAPARAAHRYEKHAVGGRGSGNSRNGKSRKKIQGDFGSVEIEVPRDRKGSHEPKIIPK
jgi:hypothetical protein